MCEAVGIRDVLAKSLGSNNHANVVKATIEALSKLRPREEIFRVRGIQMQIQALYQQSPAGLTQLGDSRPRKRTVAQAPACTTRGAGDQA